MAWEPILICRVAWTVSLAFPEFPKLCECSSKGRKIGHRSNLPRSWVDPGEKKDKSTTQLKWLKARNWIMKIARSLHFSFSKTNFIHFDQITGLIHKQGGDPFNSCLQVMRWISPSNIRNPPTCLPWCYIYREHWIQVQLSLPKRKPSSIFKRNLQPP